MTLKAVHSRREAIEAAHSKTGPQSDECDRAILSMEARPTAVQLGETNAAEYIAIRRAEVNPVQHLAIFTPKGRLPDDAANSGEGYQGDWCDIASTASSDCIIGTTPPSSDIDTTELPPSPYVDAPQNSYDPGYMAVPAEYHTGNIQASSAVPIEVLITLVGECPFYERVATVERHKPSAVSDEDLITLVGLCSFDADRIAMVKVLKPSAVSHEVLLKLVSLCSFSDGREAIFRALSG